VAEEGLDVIASIRLHRIGSGLAPGSEQVRGVCKDVRLNEGARVECPVATFARLRLNSARAPALEEAIL
jgi:hypothetical protein